MTTATIALRRNQNLTRNAAQFEAGPLTVSFMLIALVILLSLLYLNQVTKTSTFNYRISTLEQKRDSLSAEKDKLEIDAARLQSIQSAQGGDVARSMVPVENVSYVNAVR